MSHVNESLSPLGIAIAEQCKASGFATLNGHPISFRIEEMGEDEYGREYVYVYATLAGSDFAIGGAYQLDENDAVETNMLKGHYPNSIMADTVWAGEWDVWAAGEFNSLTAAELGARVGIAEEDAERVILTVGEMFAERWARSASAQ